MAAVAVHHLATREDAQVYVAAASRAQAAILFEQAVKFTLRLDEPQLVIRHLELRWCRNPDKPTVFTRFMRVLAADAAKLHGLGGSLVLVDELHAHADDSVYTTLRTGVMKTPGSKMIVISTAGQGADSPLGRLRTRALSQPKVVRRGGFTDAHGPNLRMLEWSLPEDADLDDMVKAVNPASWITVQDLAEQREAVPEMAFRRFRANQWTERESHWLPPAHGKPYKANPFSPPASRSGSASTSAAISQRAPLSGSTARIRSASRSTTATQVSSTASTRSANSPTSTTCAR